MIASSKSYYSSLAQVIVHQSVNEYVCYNALGGKIELILLEPEDIPNLSKIKEDRLSQTTRLNLVLHKVTEFDDRYFDLYKSALEDLSIQLRSTLNKKIDTQINVLSDLLFTQTMNNCGAGVNSITLSPNGKLYLCPGFYYEEPEDNIGDLSEGVVINNQHLLTINYAPICRTCDAFQCRRCIWLNHKLTGEHNTPSKQQCIISHIERNQSRVLLNTLREMDRSFAQGRVIKEIDYLDPFEKVRR